MGNLLERTAQARENLAGSATFAMSLGAKESFHTNFLAFLLESRDPLLSELQKQLREVLGLPILKGEISACAVWRERHSLDLVVVPLLNDAREQDGLQLVERRCLVVEAKLKSMPTLGQLERYLDKTPLLPYPSPDSEDTVRFKVSDEWVTRVLLTPEGVKVPNKGGRASWWVPVSWGDLCAAINTHGVPALKEGSGLRSILVDYAAALEQVLAIVVATRERMDELLAQGQYSVLMEEVTHKNLRRLRLHDLVGKVAFDEWVGKLNSGLEEQMKVSPDADKPPALVTRYVHFSNGRPGMGLEATRGDLSLGVQVQGSQLRRYVSSKNDRGDLEEIVLTAPLLKKWFNAKACRRDLTGVDGLKVTRGEYTRLTGNGKKQDALSNLRVFNAKKFLYSAIDLQGLTVADVHEEVLKSMLQAVKLQAQVAN